MYFKYGDGVKRILLMVHYFLKRLKRPNLLPEAETRWRCDLLHQIDLFRKYVFPVMLQQLQLDCAGIKSFYLEEKNCKSKMEPLSWKNLGLEHLIWIVKKVIEEMIEIFVVLQGVNNWMDPLHDKFTPI